MTLEGGGIYICSAFESTVTVLDYNHLGTDCPVFVTSERLNSSFNLGANARKGGRREQILKITAVEEQLLLSSNRLAVCWA